MKLIKTLLGTAVLGGALFSSAAFAEEATPAPAQAQAQAQAPAITQTETTAPISVGDKLNINTASSSEIQRALTGIGAKKAEAIVQYREKHGNFTSAEQLLEVQGIGKATLEKNRDRLAF